MFDELFATATVTIDADRCLNNRHDHAGCRLCVDACPTDAISIHRHLPALDPEACVRCGGCVPVCPTDAVVDSDAHERRLVETCQTLEPGPLTVACSLHPDPQSPRSGAGPIGTVVRHGRCLASLSSEHLLALSNDGARHIALDVSWCTHCPIGVAADVVVAASEQTSALLSIFTRRSDDAITLHGLPGSTDSGVAPTGDGKDVVDSRRPAFSRRGMFDSLRQRATATIIRSAEQNPPPLRHSRVAVPNRLPHNLPASRRRLLDHLNAIPPTSRTAPSEQTIPAELVPMAAVHVDAGRCSGCDLCARYCPTGALSFTTTIATGDATATFALAFRTDLCIDCNICTVACPDDAVTLGETIEAESLTHPTWSMLVSGPLVACSACDLPTAARHGETDARCFSCRLGSGVVTALRDDAGLMADLLARIPPTSEH